MFRKLIFTYLVLAIGMFAAARTAPAGERIDVEGRIARATVGGVETPSRAATAIGAQKFFIDGPMSPAIEASLGQHLRVSGIAFQRLAIGGETAPVLVVGEIALARFEPAADTLRLTGMTRCKTGRVQLGGRLFTPAGPLSKALLTLEGLEVEITGEENPRIGEVDPATDTIFITSIGTRDLTKAPAAGANEGWLLQTVSEDAIGRYSLVRPGTPAGAFDGSAPHVKTAAFDKVSGTYQVVVETFGGLIGGPMGNEIVYLYDAQGKFLGDRVL